MASAAVTERCKKNKNLLEWLDSIILAVAVLSLVFTFAARAIRVDGHSMDPTLHDQQLLIMQVPQRRSTGRTLYRGTDLHPPGYDVPRHRAGRHHLCDGG